MPREGFPLHFAVHRGETKLVASLLKKLKNQADLETVHHGATPLHVACLAGRADLCKMLVAAGANRDGLIGKGITPLMTCASHNQRDATEAMLELGADLHRADKSGMTALHHAATEGNLLAARTLLEAGADQLRRNNEGFLPLHLASLNGSAMLVKMLVEVFGSTDMIEVETSHGFRPLHLTIKGSCACKKAKCMAADAANHQCRVAAAVALLELGANVDAEDDDGKTPLSMAVCNGDSTLTKVVLDAGADTSISTDSGMAPLHVASSTCNFATTSLLLRGGANEVAETNSGSLVSDMVGASRDVRRSDAHIKGYCHMLARAPAIRAHSWLWPAVLSSPVGPASSSATASRLTVAVFRHGKSGAEKNWVPIAAMFRYSRKK